jgi:hypothetical protein
MGQVVQLLVQCAVLTSDQQLEIYADTDSLLDEYEQQCTLRSTAQDALLSLCSTKSGGVKRMPVEHLKQVFMQVIVIGMSFDGASYAVHHAGRDIGPAAKTARKQAVVGSFGECPRVH